MNVLVVEDDDLVSKTIKMNWPDKSSYIKIVSSYRQTIPLTHGANLDTFDAVIADIQLPDGSGLEVLRDVRRTSNIPFLLVSGFGDPDARASAIDRGADDYIMKPFGVRELYARVKRQMQLRDEKIISRPREIFFIEEVKCDLQKLKLETDQAQIDLTTMEGRILEILWKKCNRDVSKAELYKNAFHRQQDARDKTLDVYICRIRKKLRKIRPNRGDPIQTIRGSGYRLIIDI